jgi:hypothetical protein
MASASPARSESSDEEYEYAIDIFRTDGYWYNDAYKVLQKFACMLTGEELARLPGFPLPVELCEVIGQYTWDNDVYGIARLAVARTASGYILTTLQERMTALRHGHPDCVHSADPYMNVINYFRAVKGDEFLKELMHGEDKYLLENVLPWLGLTDWGSNSGSKGGKYGGRTRQMDIFKYKLKQFLKQISPSKKRSAREPASSAEESVAAPASAAAPAYAEPLSPEELREARKKYFGIPEGSRGGKRLHTRKLRMLRKRKSKSSKRTCKRCRSARS